MSTLGFIHTVVSIFPIGFGLVAFARDRKIDPKNWVGKFYLITMFLGSTTALGFIVSRGFTPGQILTLATLGLLLAGVVTGSNKWRGGEYVQTISLTMSYLLLMVFTTTETLTRLPIDSPFASGPTDPALIPVRLGLLALFFLGMGYQVHGIHDSNKRMDSLRRVIAEYRPIARV